MYEMVQNAYKVTLVSCIVPLAAGIYWKRANNVGAILSVVFGLVVLDHRRAGRRPEATVPPQLVGLAFSIVGMVLGSLVPRAAPATPTASTEPAAVRRAPRRSRGSCFWSIAALALCVALSVRGLARRRGLAVRLSQRAVAALRHAFEWWSTCWATCRSAFSRWRRCSRALRGAAAFVLAGGGAALLSLVLEAAQTYLPARFATNLDMLCNLLARRSAPRSALRFAPAAREGRFRAPRARAFLPGAGIDFGLVLIGLWLFIQLNPARCCSAPATCAISWRRARAARDRPEFFVIDRGVHRRGEPGRGRPAAFVARRPGRAGCAQIVRLAGGRRARGQDRGVRDPDARRERGRLAHARRADRLAVGIACALAGVALPRTARLVLPRC